MMPRSNACNDTPFSPALRSWRPCSRQIRQIRPPSRYHSRHAICAPLSSAPTNPHAVGQNNSVARDDGIPQD